MSSVADRCLPFGRVRFTIEPMVDHSVESPPNEPVRPRSTRWHYAPDEPLRPAPFLRWPIDLGRIVRYVVRSWTTLTPRVVMLLVAIGIWWWAMPDPSTAEHVAPGWIATVWARNLAIVLVTAGGAHLWLYRWRRQGDRRRFDTRPLATDSRPFLMRDQVRDNMLLTLVSAVAVWTAVEVLMLWSAANGLAPVMSFADHPVGFVVFIVLIPVLSASYFGVFHRLLHTRRAFRYVHSWHHRNVNLGPWSGLAMHPAEHVVLFSDALLLFLVPFHPVHLYFIMLHHGMGAPLSHTGYDDIELPLGTRIRVGDFHHQLHHRYPTVNFGGIESPVDQLLGTFHDGTVAADAEMAARRRASAARR